MQDKDLPLAVLVQKGNKNFRLGTKKKDWYG
jgi:hypothetical protein